MKNDFDLFDPYRYLYPNKVEYSWSHMGISCRLDRFYLSSILKDCPTSVVIEPCTFSDHDFVILSLSCFEDAITAGPGYWKCNTSILEDEDFHNNFVFMCNQLCQEEVKDADWWEYFKQRSKSLIIDYSRRNSRARNKEIIDMENHLRKLYKLNVLHPGKYSADIRNCKNELNNLLLCNIEGSKIRSRAKLFDSSEKPSRYFLRREKKRSKKKLITSLQTEDGRVSDNPSIRNVCYNFYKQLYTSSSIDKDLLDYFTHDLPQLSEEDRLFCEGNITYDECFEALKSFANNKTPGSDGLPKEFYVKYFPLFGQHFVEVINNCFDLGTLTPSQRKGLITLICKDESKAEFLKCWRPISLLNIDYKIVSKVLTIRLSKVIGCILHIDQTSSIPHRSIVDNCHLFRNILDYIDQNPTRLAFISLDQEKAFDYVNHSYMFNVLAKYGFGPSFLKWVKLLYTDIVSCVNVNGF